MQAKVRRSDSQCYGRPYLSLNCVKSWISYSKKARPPILSMWLPAMKLYKKRMGRDNVCFFPPSQSLYFLNGVPQLLILFSELHLTWNVFV